MSARILIADDEPNQLELLFYNLTKEGFEVHRAHDGRQAIEMAEELRPDLIILDWMMPEYSGIDVCRMIQKSDQLRSTAVIMLSARGEEGDRTFGLDTGADDYITKPFSPRELIARIKAVLRRANPSLSGDLKSFHDVVVDHHRMIVKRGGVPVHLGPKEFKLLATLMERPGQVYSREQLLERVWGQGVYVEDRTVDVHLSRLRKALNKSADGDDSKDDIVRTIRGAGYALRAPNSE